MSGRERRRHIRRTLNALERAAGIEPEQRDAKPRQRYAYATKELGTEMIAVSRKPGWHSGREETPAQMEWTARQLEATAAWWSARADAGLVTPDLEGYHELIAGKVATLRERAAAAHEVERQARAPRRLHMSTLTDEDCRRLRLPAALAPERAA
jgi:hypothetical protein